MCKLCKTKKPQVTRSHKKRTPIALEFRDIVCQYTGEFPCVNCSQLFGQAICKNQIHNIDDYIISKLWKNYGSRPYGINKTNSIIFKMFSYNYKVVQD